MKNEFIEFTTMELIFIVIMVAIAMFCFTWGLFDIINTIITKRF